MPSHATPLAAAAHAYLQAGLCVLPARRAEKRPAIKGRWEPFKSRRPTDAEVDAWFANEQDALCLVCGAVSGHLEAMDFDCGGELIDRWTAKVEAVMPGLTAKVVIESTPSSGWHVGYRYASAVCGNLKLAQRKHIVCDADIQRDAQGRETVVLHGKAHAVRTDAEGVKHVILTLIETRGEGGLFLCAPTPGYELIQGDFRALPVLTEAERDVLQQAAWELNEYLPPVVDCPPHSAIVSQRSPSSAAQGGGATNSADRPGDDFNQRGDVRAVLTQHGWTLAKPASGSDANEYWCRPGKASGWSASLKSNVLYVFSSNATPFEPNRAYSPFAVYALLEHGGDWAQAASSLRVLGYGSDCAADNAHGADISAIVQLSAASAACGPHDGAVGQTSALCDEQPPGAPETADPGPMSDDMLRMPGFVGEVMDHCLATAPYPSPVMAFAGALSLLALLAGRKVCDPGDNRTNLYLLGLAHSASGKDWPRKVNTRILHEVGLASCVGERFASGEGIQDALFQTPCMLFQTDEIDGMLQSINKAKDARHEAIMSTLLTMYSSANSVFPMRRKAGKELPGVIDQPCLVIFGTAIPNHYYEALSERMLTNGFFARMIILEAGARSNGQEPAIRDVPPRVIETAKWWTNFQPGERRLNLIEVHPVPVIVEHTAEARTAIIETRRQAEAEYAKAEAGNDSVGTTVWGRVSEHVRKLALLYAVSENHLAPSIGIDAVRWASAFVLHQTRRMLSMASQHVADGEFDALIKRAVKLLRQWREKNGPDALMPAWELRRRLKQRPNDFKDIVLELAERRIAMPDTERGVTKPKSGYRLL